MSALIQPYRFAGSAFVPSAWDPASATGTYTFDEADRHFVDTNAASDNSHMRSVRSYTSGKRKFEVQSLVNTSPAQPGIGVCTSASRGSYLGSNTASLALYNSAEGVYYNGSVQSGTTSFPQLFIGDWMSVEVDLDAGQVYFQSTSSVGRWAFALPFGGAVYACIGTFVQNDAMRANFGNAAWHVTPTPGFEEGW